MAYRRPFTLQQRREAMAALRSYEKHRQLLRRSYPPSDREESATYDQYVQAIEEMRQELLRADRTVRVERLNRLDAEARWLATEYWRLRIGKQ
ncbi:MAG TPA: hypothetical protein VLI90_12895 [Tepidisphaeraceae bacterium]|nr:hypothetical protein [Tepidisphaeraceae bacterium]